jgi:hypothetical protein
MVDVKQIEATLHKHFLVTGPITHIDPETGLIDVDGSVYLRKKVGRMPVQFGHVTGSFGCADGKLTTLMGAPHHVRGSFSCMGNLLTSLNHAPEYVGRDFKCAHNKLTNLMGAPNQVGEDFQCHSNPLTSLDGAPVVIPGWFWVTYTAKLPLLRTLVAQQRVELPDSPLEVAAILNDPEFKLKGKPGAIKCAVALIKAGYKDNARW